MAKNWKTRIPTSLTEALRLSKDCACERKNLSVERIAELMAVTPDALYKWLSTGRMPASLIPVYEHVCDCALVSRYLATASGGLVIDAPIGKAVQAQDVQALQAVLNDAVGAILGFANGKTSADETIVKIMAGMAGLGWHKANISQHQQPRLDFFGDDHDTQ